MGDNWNNDEIVSLSGLLVSSQVQIADNNVDGSAARIGVASEPW